MATNKSVGLKEKFSFQQHTHRLLHRLHLLWSALRCKHSISKEDRCLIEDSGFSVEEIVDYAIMCDSLKQRVNHYYCTSLRFTHLDEMRNRYVLSVGKIVELCRDRDDFMRDLRIQLPTLEACVEHLEDEYARFATSPSMLHLVDGIADMSYTYASVDYLSYICSIK